jgi:linoleoyl-CoA desaturase
MLYFCPTGLGGLACALGFGFISAAMTLTLGHEASHRALTHLPWLDDWIYLISMSLVGIDAEYWKKAHLESHHLWTNLPTHDVGNGTNHILRLSERTPPLPRYRYQHYYAWFLYPLYSLGLITGYDWNTWRTGKLLQTSFRQGLPKALQLLFLKITYFTLMIGVPYYFSNYSLTQVLVGFVCIHLVVSLVLTLFLFVSHVSDLVQFNSITQKSIAHSFIRNQLITTVDIYPKNKALNFLLGGFNAHTLHHLYPDLSSIHYPSLIDLLIQKTKTYQLPYLISTWPLALRSHYRYLKRMGEAT